MKWTQRDATVEVYTTREGALSAVGHDLVLGVNSFQVELEDGELVARVDAQSLKVEGTVGADGTVSRPGLSRIERAKVERSIVKDVLHAKKHPTIRFEGTFDISAAELSGELELLGQRRAISAPVIEDSGVWRGEFVVHQPDFGIEPYRAFMGALKVEADVTVRFEVPKP